jgi:hypothetical protein
MKNEEMNYGLMFAYLCSPFPELMTGPQYFEPDSFQDQESERPQRRETIGDLVRRLLPLARSESIERNERGSPVEAF